MRIPPAAQSRRLPYATLALAIGLLPALTLAACRAPAPEPHDPSVVGIVASRELLAGSRARFGLVSGKTIDIDQSVASNLNGVTPDVGDLLFYGVQPQPWFVGLNPVSEDRFDVYSQPDDAQDGSITFDFGLRLPLAKTYDETGAGQLEAGAPVLYLVNGKGEVIDRR